MDSDESLNSALILIENYYFGEGENCGERLFIDFAKKHKTVFLNSKISESTENKFEFTELFQEFQVVYEQKLEELIKQAGLSIDSFYEGIKRVK
jgi:hypothetical protein